MTALQQKQEANMQALRQENEVIWAQLQQSQENTQHMGPTHHVALEGEHSSHDTNQPTNIVEWSQQRSQSQPFELHRQHPFVDDILNAPLPLGWKPLNIDWYDGTTNPDEHLKAYIT